MKAAYFDDSDLLNRFVLDMPEERVRRLSIGWLLLLAAGCVGAEGVQEEAAMKDAQSEVVESVDLAQAKKMECEAAEAEHTTRKKFTIK